MSEFSGKFPELGNSLEERVERYWRVYLQWFVPIPTQTVYCVLCTVYCVLCTVYCVLCTVYCVLCTVYCVLCTVYCVLCTVYCVLCTVYCVLCTVYCVLCTVSHLKGFCSTKVADFFFISPRPSPEISKSAVSGCFTGPNPHRSQKTLFLPDFARFHPISPGFHRGWGHPIK